jgi:hypothetical protein
VGVIGVVMGEENRVHAIDAGCDQLQTHLGWCVDQYSRTTIRLDQRSDASSLVARIRRTAHFTAAPQHGDAEAGAGAEEEEAH